MATFFISIFVLLMQFLWKYIDEMVGKGLEWTVIAKLLFYVSGSLVPMALPLAILLSSLMTFGNLGEHYELVAFKSAGISLKRILRPLTFVIVGLSILAFAFSNYWLPIANLKSKSLLYDIKEQKPTMDIQAGIFSNELDGLSIRVKDKKTIDGVEHLYDVLIYDHSDGVGNRSVITAEEGVLTLTKDKRYLEFRLYNGESYEEDKDGKQKNKFGLARSKFRENVIRQDLAQFELNRTDEELFKTNYKMLNLEQLEAAIDTLSKVRSERLEEFENGLMQSYMHFNSLKEKKDKKKVIIEEPFDFDEFVAALPLSHKKQLMNTASNLGRNSKSRLESISKDLYERTKYINRHYIQWHKKLTLPFACIILFLIGAPLGAIIRKGGLGMPIVISVVFFLLFHILSTTGEKMAKEGSLSPIEGMWMASVILLPIGVFFTLKATSDSALFKADGYVDFIKRAFRKESNKLKA